ncbi:hypothetical protein [Saccharothrix longispora]|uniref:hypothetical protein n=1 Tax=Saccharothrix longispora TaxID=33920 RepID=UPI0028FDBCEB|nr:hypothetical protein [Saccharothrix longispora]MBY8847822.1 hypothetical protein [Saccharothrix sp. MB29]MDU0291057.1 hypothetical protein [Saccharothrix longispora]
MRVRVRFRYRVDTGEVEVFQVDDLVDGPRAADHDARHDAATLDVARVVDPNPRFLEVAGTPPAEAPRLPEIPRATREDPLRD